MSKENRFEGLMGAVGKKSNVQTSKVSAKDSNTNASTFKRSNVQMSKAKSANPDYVRTTIYLPRKMHKKLKAIAVEEEREMSQIMEELLGSWLESK